MSLEISCLLFEYTFRINSSSVHINSIGIRMSITYTDGSLLLVVINELLKFEYTFQMRSIILDCVHT